MGAYLLSTERLTVEWEERGSEDGLQRERMQLWEFALAEKGGGGGGRGGGLGGGGGGLGEGWGWGGSKQMCLFASSSTETNHLNLSFFARGGKKHFDRIKGVGRNRIMTKPLLPEKKSSGARGAEKTSFVTPPGRDRLPKKKADFQSRGKL